MTAKAPPKAKTPKPKPSDVELEPDAWERFEAAVDRAVKPKRKAADDGSAVADKDRR